MRVWWYRDTKGKTVRHLGGANAQKKHPTRLCRKRAQERPIRCALCNRREQTFGLVRSAATTCGLGPMLLSQTHVSTPVDGQNPIRTTVQKPWNDDFPSNTNKPWLSMFATWGKMASIHGSIIVLSLSMMSLSKYHCSK